MTARSNPAALRNRLDHWWTLCMACTLMWGLWGFLSKLLADRTGAVATQLLFTAGMLPAAIVAGCVRLARRLGLSLAGFRFERTADGPLLTGILVTGILSTALCIACRQVIASGYRLKS